MDFLTLCNKRYSLRKYSPRKVPREVIDRCLEAARLAPSACNSQPWSFIVADDDELRPALARAAFGGLASMNKFAMDAPALIVIVTEKSRYAAALGGSLRGTTYALIDIGIAGEHLCLQAAEEGLGSCWIGWFNEKAVKELLGLPRTSKLDAIIALGYPAEGTEPREKRRKPLGETRKYAREQPWKH